MIGPFGDSSLLVLGLLLAPVVLALGIWSQRRRTRTIQAWATAAGWRYVGSDPSLVTRWRGTPFGVGHGHQVSDLVTGRFAGRPSMSFTYRYRTGSGKEESTYTFHVVATSLPAYLPNLQLTPEHLGARIARAFGRQDIQFESEDFNRAWRVQAGVERFAHDVLHPRLMERLLQPDARMNLRIEATDILCWAPGSTSLSRVAARLGVLAAVVDAVPRFVWQDHGYDPGYGPDAGRPGVAPAEPPLGATLERPPSVPPLEGSPYRPPTT